MNDRDTLHALIDAIESQDSIQALRSIAFDLLSMQERERRKNYLRDLTSDIDDIEDYLP